MRRVTRRIIPLLGPGEAPLFDRGQFFSTAPRIKKRGPPAGNPLRQGERSSTRPAPSHPALNAFHAPAPARPTPARPTRRRLARPYSRSRSATKHRASDAPMTATSASFPPSIDSPVAMNPSRGTDSTTSPRTRE